MFRFTYACSRMLCRDRLCLTRRLHLKNSATRIAHQFTKRTHVSPVHFIEVSRLIGHRFTYASQVHTLAIQQALQLRRLRLGWRQRTAWCGSEVSRNWCPRSDGRVWRRHGLRQHSGLFDAHDLHPARADETMTAQKLQLFLQSDQRCALARLWASVRRDRWRR